MYIHAEKAAANAKAGADVIVVGNAIEKDPQLIIDISKAIMNSHHLENPHNSNERYRRNRPVVGTGR